MHNKTDAENNFSTNNEIRWCPGCGNYAILATMKKVLAESGLPKEQVVFISGIGCSGRFPYYVNVNGFHTIHGRGATIATGLKLARPDLTIFLIVGDGDALSIGLGHFIHLLRRDIDINIILINNQVYGLTKGQPSPTSTIQAKYGDDSTRPIEPLSIAYTAGCGFLARVIDIDDAGIRYAMTQAIMHPGCSLIEIYQNCHVFNDNAFHEFRNKQQHTENKIWVEKGMVKDIPQLIIQNKPRAFGIFSA